MNLKTPRVGGVDRGDGASENPAANGDKFAFHIQAGTPALNRRRSFAMLRQLPMAQRLPTRPARDAHFVRARKEIESCGQPNSFEPRSAACWSRA